VTRDEILAALRSEGVPDLARVEALVLETDSSFSVLTSETSTSSDSTLSTLASVSRHEDQRA
jgi:uncharacterized membrane protein YcaP (DUF421 family)